MMVIGIDAHKRSHTAVTVDEMGRQGFVKTVGTTTQDHLRLLKWAGGLAEERLWAIEDCRHLTRRLERDLIAAGESVVRVSPKLMAHVRDSARSYGKSDPIDDLAVARAALREPDLPTARLDGIEREIRLFGRPSRRPRRRAHPHHRPAALASARARPELDSTDKTGAAQCIRQGQGTPIRSQRRRHGPATGTAARRALAAAHRRDQRTHRRDHRPSHHDCPVTVGHRGLRGTERLITQPDKRAPIIAAIRELALQS